MTFSFLIEQSDLPRIITFPRFLIRQRRRKKIKKSDLENSNGDSRDDSVDSKFQRNCRVTRNSLSTLTFELTPWNLVHWQEGPVAAWLLCHFFPLLLSPNPRIYRNWNKLFSFSSWKQKRKRGKTMFLYQGTFVHSRGTGSKNDIFLGPVEKAK